MNPSQPVDLIKLCHKYLTNQFRCRVSFVQGRSPSSVNTYVCLVAQLCLTLCNPMDCSHQAPLSVGFPRQEYWSDLPFLPPGCLVTYQFLKTDLKKCYRSPLFFFPWKLVLQNSSKQLSHKQLSNKQLSNK